MKKESLRGKWAVVTGADGGIGMEFCRELAGRGCSLLMISNRRESLQETAKAVAIEFNVTAIPFTLDLSTFDASANVMKFIEQESITPDFLINNAGIFSFAPVVETPERKLNCFIDLHVGATVSMSKEFAAYFASHGGGRILNMSSMSCWMPMPGIAMYAATKAFIRVFSRALYYEMKDKGVSVTVACPGGIATDLFGLPPKLKKLAVRIGAITTPQKFTRKAVNRMLKGRKQYINGGLNRLSILLVSLTPTYIRMLIKRKMLDKNIRV